MLLPVLKERCLECNGEQDPSPYKHRLRQVRQTIDTALQKPSHKSLFANHLSKV